MAERMQRTQILLEPEQHRALAEIARREKRSVSDVVREMIRRGLEERERTDRATTQRRLEALERIRRHRDEVLARRGGEPLDVDVVEMIRQIRGERDERNLAGFVGRRD